VITSPLRTIPFDEEGYILCAVLAEKYGKWPHEVLLCRNDKPGRRFDLSLTIFDLQAMSYLEQARARAAKQK
jgi:hypothetical protein